MDAVVAGLLADGGPAAGLALATPLARNSGALKALSGPSGLIGPSGLSGLRELSDVPRGGSTGRIGTCTTRRTVGRSSELGTSIKARRGPRCGAGWPASTVRRRSAWSLSTRMPRPWRPGAKRRQTDNTLWTTVADAVRSRPQPGQELVPGRPAKRSAVQFISSGNNAESPVTTPMWSLPG